MTDKKKDVDPKKSKSAQKGRDTWAAMKRVRKEKEERDRVVEKIKRELEERDKNGT